jgi:hypothetical protein
MSATCPNDLSDAEWVCPERYLAPMSKRCRSHTTSLRRIGDATFYVLRKVVQATMIPCANTTQRGIMALDIETLRSVSIKQKAPRILDDPAVELTSGVSGAIAQKPS